MNIPYATYAAMTTGLFISCFPPFMVYSHLSGHYRKGLRQRLGFVPLELSRTLKGSPRIWMHAVSLGEIKAGAAIIEALKRLVPDCSVLISTTTDHGLTLAEKTFGRDVPVVYAPVDTVFSVRKALSRVRPDIMVFLETEIWPAWLTEAHRMGIKIAIANGRISVRSIGGYLKFRPFFREALKNVDAFSMILEEDGTRIRAIGADPYKVKINGNAKYDLLSRQADPLMEKEMRDILNLKTSQTVFVAGSTREGEEALVLGAYKKITGEFPDMVLALAPRHIERTGEIRRLVEGMSLTYQLRSELGGGTSKRTASVVIFNTFGELFKLYSVGTIIFCGGSLVPLGGQNPLEAAVWGKMVFYGPSMEDFSDAKMILEKAGAGITVTDSEMLAEKAIMLLRNPDVLKMYGSRAREAVIKNKNSAERHARVIAGLL